MKKGTCTPREVHAPVVAVPIANAQRIKILSAIKKSVGEKEFFRWFRLDTPCCVDESTGRLVFKVERSLDLSKMERPCIQALRDVAKAHGYKDFKCEMLDPTAKKEPTEDWRAAKAKSDQEYMRQAALETA